MNHMSERGMKIIHVIETCCTTATGFITILFIQAGVFLSPIIFNIYLVGVLIIVDVITALIGLFMQCKRESDTLKQAWSTFYVRWTSRRAFDSIPKFIYYGMFVFLYHYIGNLYGDPVTFSKAATGFIIYIEGRSIIENGDKAFGTNMWSLVSDKLTSLLPGKKKKE